MIMTMTDDDFGGIKVTSHDMDWHWHLSSKYYIVGISALLWFCVGRVIQIWITPEKITNLQKWKNVTVSFLHAVISGPCALACFAMLPGMAEDMKGTFDVYSFCLVAMSVGYFVYDTIDMLCYCSCRDICEVMFHHVTVLICFSIAVVMEQYVAYATLSLVQEMNSIFLHLRLILRMSGFSRNDNAYRLCSLVNIGTFIVFRIAILTWMTRWIVLNHAVVPLLIYTIGSCGLFILTIVNIILFYRLLLSDFFQASRLYSVKQCKVTS